MLCEAEDMGHWGSAIHFESKQQEFEVNSEFDQVEGGRALELQENRWNVAECVCVWGGGYKLEFVEEFGEGGRHRGINATGGGFGV